MSNSLGSLRVSLLAGQDQDQDQDQDQQDSFIGDQAAREFQSQKNRQLYG